MKARARKKNKKADKLTLRESAFLKHIEAGMTITRAARSAGYSQKWPGQAGTQAFRNIKKKRPEILDDLGLTVAALLRRLGLRKHIKTYKNIDKHLLSA
jgi:signal transduction histidine kinase